MEQKIQLLLTNAAKCNGIAIRDFMNAGSMLD